MIHLLLFGLGNDDALTWLSLDETGTTPQEPGFPVWRQHVDV